jgi:hypothetical protein
MSIFVNLAQKLKTGIVWELSFGSCIRVLRPYRGLRGEATQYAKVLAKTGQRPSRQGFYRFWRRYRYRSRVASYF